MILFKIFAVQIFCISIIYSVYRQVDDFPLMSPENSIITYNL